MTVLTLLAFISPDTLIVAVLTAPILVVKDAHIISLFELYVPVSPLASVSHLAPVALLTPVLPVKPVAPVAPVLQLNQYHL